MSKPVNFSYSNTLTSTQQPIVKQKGTMIPYIMLEEHKQAWKKQNQYTASVHSELI